MQSGLSRSAQAGPSCPRFVAPQQRCTHIVSRRSRAGLETAVRSRGDWVQSAADEVSKASQETAKRVRRAAREVQGQAVRAVSETSRRFNLDEKFRRARTRAVEVWRDVDQQFDVSLRAREIKEDVSRKWPVWRRRAEEFFQSPIGKISAVFGIYLLIVSGILWRILSFAYLLFIFGPLVAYFFDVRSPKQKEEAMQDLLEKLRNSAAAQKSGGRQSGRRGGKGGDDYIDVEYTTK